MCNQSMDSELRVSFTTHLSCQKECQIFLTHSLQAEAIKIWQLQS